MLSDNQTFPDHVFNDFCDNDSNWGPLLFLRPERSEAIGTLRMAVGAVLLGLPFGLFGSILFALYSRVTGQEALTLMYFPLVLIVLYGIVARLTVVRAWNRRAERLARLAPFTSES